MDRNDVEKACMADLGRQRQDELPLSEREGKRPSFQPTRGNGTGHYAPSLTKGLESKWKGIFLRPGLALSSPAKLANQNSPVQIEDEESAEMQGLAVDDSRPWAKITETYMSRHHADTAPPLVGQRLRGGKAVNLHPRPQQPQNIHKRQSEDKAETITASRPASNAISKVETKTKSRNTVPESAPMTNPLPIRSKTFASEQTVYNELCKMVDPESKKPLFVVKLSLRIQNDSHKAVLVLAASNKEDKLHNVLDMPAPHIQDDYCLFYPRGMATRSRYMFQFPTASEANKFGLYFESLQRAAARTVGAPSNSGNHSKNTKRRPRVRLPPSTTKEDFMLNKSEPGETSHSDKASNPEKRGEIETKLVDVESPSTTCEQEVKVPTLEDAAQSLFDLIEKILPEAAAAGLNVSEDAISDIQETAIESWLERGFLKSESDDMKSELLELLRILVRIKRKAESLKKAAQPKPPVVIQSLKDFESTASNANRIKYSFSEIQNLSSGSAAAPAGLNKSIVTPRRNQAPGEYSPAAVAAAVVSKNKAWLSGNSTLQKPDATSLTPPMSNEKSASNACLVASEAGDKGGISSLQSPSVVRGLGTSRWARD
ncbi:hypothetical protein E4U55_007340 [Claviceps digitariae]|nr:hypothetical protein E4U55_007340 [Claviceps digitariae]